MVALALAVQIMHPSRATAAAEIPIRILAPTTAGILARPTAQAHVLS